MNCENCRTRLPDHCRGQLAAAETAEVVAHLQHCAACDAEYAGMQRINALLDIEASPSDSLREQFLARLQRETRPAPPRFAALFQAWWPSRPLGAFSYSAALLLCGVISGQWLPDNGMTDSGNDIADRSVQLCPIPPSSQLL